MKSTTTTPTAKEIRDASAEAFADYFAHMEEGQRLLAEGQRVLEARYGKDPTPPLRARELVAGLIDAMRRLLKPPATKSKGQVEKDGEPSYKRAHQPRITGEKDVGHVQGPLHDYFKALGVPQSVQPKLAAKFDALVKAEITGREAAPKLSDARLAAFMEHAAANQWNPESEERESPSAFIKKTFKDWLGRGLGLEHVRKAQKNLATAYSAEVHREPSNRIAKLQTRPHTRHSKEPPALETTKVTRSGWIPTSELSDEQTALRRKNQAASKREARQAAQATLT